GIAFAVAEPAAEEAVAVLEAVGVVAAARERLAHRAREPLGHALVHVQAQDPVVLRDGDRVLLLATEAQPLLLLHARAVALRDLDGLVGAARIDHEDLVGETDAREARADLARGVE